MIIEKASLVFQSTPYCSCELKSSKHCVLGTHLTNRGYETLSLYIELGMLEHSPMQLTFCYLVAGREPFLSGSSAVHQWLEPVDWVAFGYSNSTIQCNWQQYMYAYSHTVQWESWFLPPHHRFSSLYTTLQPI